MSIATKLATSPRKEPLIVLGIESSCDETAAAVLSKDGHGEIKILSSIISSQDAAHAPYGGVVPEIAARAHVQKLDGIIAKAVDEAGIGFDALGLIAVTSGPGLIGGVMTGLMSAKGLALSLGLPIIGVNHLEGHALSPRLTQACPFPYLLLLVSGGHTQLLAVTGLGEYARLGSTVDDALGEAFDKTAKIMGLGFPGGPKVEQAAMGGNPARFDLPRPLMGKPGADFSFSGLKTAVSRTWAASDKSPQTAADLAASFQAAICDVATDRAGNAMDMFMQSAAGADSGLRFVVAGGVAANRALSQSLAQLSAIKGFDFFTPPIRYCTDNAAMIALAGLERFEAGERGDLTISARARWPLDAQAARDNPASGFGKKGPKS